MWIIAPRRFHGTFKLWRGPSWAAATLQITWQCSGLQTSTNVAIHHQNVQLGSRFKTTSFLAFGVMVSTAKTQHLRPSTKDLIRALALYLTLVLLLQALLVEARETLPLSCPSRTFRSRWFSSNWSIDHHYFCSHGLSFY